MLSKNPKVARKLGEEQLTCQCKAKFTCTLTQANHVMASLTKIEILYLLYLAGSVTHIKEIRFRKIF